MRKKKKRGNYNSEFDAEFGDGVSEGDINSTNFAEGDVFKSEEKRIEAINKIITLIVDYANHRDIKDISKKHGISEGRLRLILTHYGFYFPKSRQLDSQSKLIDEKEWSTIRDEYTLPEISFSRLTLGEIRTILWKQFGKKLSYFTIRGRLKEKGYLRAAVYVREDAYYPDRYEFKKRAMANIEKFISEVKGMRDRHSFLVAKAVVNEAIIELAATTPESWFASGSYKRICEKALSLEKLYEIRFVNGLEYQSDLLLRNEKVKQGKFTEKDAENERNDITEKVTKQFDTQAMLERMLSKDYAPWSEEIDDEENEEGEDDGKEGDGE